jgi:hypothetical protein
MQRLEWNTAQKYLEESLKLSKSVPDYKYWLASISRLIHVAAKKGQADRLDEFKTRLDECLQSIGKPDKNSEGIAYLGLAKLAFIQNSIDMIPDIIHWLQKGIPHIVLYGSWARTDIVTRLAIIEEDFQQTATNIIQEVGRRMTDFIYLKEEEDYLKEEEDLNFSTALEIIHRWINWKG